MRLAKWVFLIAGIYGLFVVAPTYFLERRLGEDYPPPVTHPEFYYGFAGCCLAWQLMYLLIGSDPARYRPVMLLGAAAKASFIVAVVALHLQGRVAAAMVGIAAPDAVSAVLFVVAWLRTPNQPA